MEPVQPHVKPGDKGPDSPPSALCLRSGLLASLGFRHGFSTRLAGDDVDLVALTVLAQTVGFRKELSYQVSQVHGATILEGRGDPTELRAREADGLVAVEPGVAVGIRVADCVPVLLADRNGGAVAAVHAGWRGVTAGIVPAAIAALVARGAKRENLVAAVGPHIGPCCFEVGADVADVIAAATRADVVARRSGDKAYVDLRAGVVAQLRREGLGEDAIDHVTGCTRCDASRFFSFRREGKAAGRHLAVIVAREQSE